MESSQTQGICRYAAEKRRRCRQLTSTAQICGEWNSMEGKRGHGIIWKHYEQGFRIRPLFSAGAKGVESGVKGRQIQRPFHSHVQFLRIYLRTIRVERAPKPVPACRAFCISSHPMSLPTLLMHFWLQAIVNIYHAALSPLPWPLQLHPSTVASSSESITPVHLTRQNLSLLISASNLVFFTAIDSPNRAVSILANGVF